ncbi:hypothetical protein [Aquimarina aggregata]|uniref:hypothetical protein n=1 Tax=Aquimarina aggregata TaxID=1642818 RepID=UPI002492D58D|nr:hypothetical protein [Aquimarina aggregata]
MKEKKHQGAWKDVVYGIAMILVAFFLYYKISQGNTGGSKLRTITSLIGKEGVLIVGILVGGFLIGLGIWKLVHRKS